jgi:hypothetical protein
MGLACASEIIALVLVVAVMLLGGNLLGPLSESPSSGAIISGVIGGVVYVMTTMLFQGMITYTIFQLFMRNAASVWESLTRSLSRVLTVFLGTVAAIAGGGLVCFGTAFILSRLGPIGALFSVLVTTILMSFFFTTWFVFAPACVVERLGALASLDRSGKLTKGYRLRISGIFLLLVLISKTVSFIADKVIPDLGIISVIVKTLIVLIPVTFASLAPAVVYYSLRVAKENLTPESLADIFD